jgi:hypothetical protein
MIWQDAAAKKQPICVFEISNNSTPIWADGAVSNARTYTKKVLEILLRDVDSKNYKWDIGSFRTPGNPLAMLYIVGLADSNPA